MPTVAVLAGAAQKAGMAGIAAVAARILVRTPARILVRTPVRILGRIPVRIPGLTATEPRLHHAAGRQKLV
jgi:hypothetical protein